MSALSGRASRRTPVEGPRGDSVGLGAFSGTLPVLPLRRHASRNLCFAYMCHSVRMLAASPFVESWRNPDPDGAVSYEFCNACNCPASCCCVCKHLLTGRIDYFREGNSAAWSDALLAPMTHGRERTLYGTGRGDESDLATAITSVAGDGSDSDSDIDDENGALRLPRGIVCLPTGMQPPCFADMLTPKPPARPPPQIDVEAALAGIIADCDALRTFASDRDMLCRRQAHELALKPTVTCLWRSESLR